VAGILNRFGLAVVVVTIVVLVFWSGLHRQVSFAGLQRNYTELRQMCAQHPVASAGLFMAIYVGGTMAPAPGALWYTITGGCLFGWLAGACYAWIAGMASASLVLARREPRCAARSR
jgi:uncharacterized membrane protein YdjX (TVP38/TMEM64 family)